MIPEPGLYTGTLRHRRYRPRAHAFSYELFMAWLDVDRIPDVMARSRLTGFNRFNWASYDDRDHLGAPSESLRERVTTDARAHGVSLERGPIYLLTHLRYLGYCFNPISLFFCYDATHTLQAVLAEVNNTFGERRTYWLWADNRQAGRADYRYRCAKDLHVSPFMPMDLDYEFVLSEPGEALVVHMATHDRHLDSPPLFDATMTLAHRPWTPHAIRMALLRHPWMTIKVIAAIHWQAFRLLIKRVPVFTHPAHVQPAPKHNEGSR